MREIRFRAWDKDKKVMVHEFAIWSNFSGGVVKNNNLILMQYTGLKDKNGTEIYEGDIVDTATHMPREEYGLTYCTIIEWDERTGYLPFIDYEDFTMPEDLGNIEVIGNIYENPELLRD